MHQSRTPLNIFYLFLDDSFHVKFNIYKDIESYLLFFSPLWAGTTLQGDVKGWEINLRSSLPGLQWNIAQDMEENMYLLFPCWILDFFFQGGDKMRKYGY